MISAGFVNNNNSGNNNNVNTNQDPQNTKHAAGTIFNDLLESSKNLPSTSSELGSIQLSLHEINRRTRELRNAHYNKNDGNVDDHQFIQNKRNKASDRQALPVDHTKAHYLLANSGVAFDDIDSSLKFLKSGEANKFKRNNIVGQTHNNNDNNLTSQTQSSMEIDSYLKIKKEENILSSIESLLSNAAKDFDSFVNSNLNLDWNERKNTIRENFGILINNKGNTNNLTSSNTYPNDFVSATLKKHSINPEIPVWGNNSLRILNDNNNESKLNVNENHLVRENFETHAKIVYKFNNSRQSGQSIPLTKEFISLLSKNANDTKNRQMLEAWKILDTLNDRQNLTKTDTVERSKIYLEKQFLDYVNLLYNKKMDEGLPTNINKVKSFIDSKLKNTDNSWKIKNLTVANSIPIWALIFYLLRAGLKTEALEVAVSNKSSFKKVEQSFLGYFKAYTSSKDGTLPLEFSNRLHTEYNQHIKNSLNGDPFRLAVYKIIGRCDLTRKNISSVTLNVEDWLWVHFMLMKDDITEDDPIYERYTFTDFQNIVTSYGPSRFTNHYLQVLVLSGLYELAIAYVYTINEMDAVHLAIVMASLNLLKFPSITSIVNKTEQYNRDISNNNNSANGTGFSSFGERLLSINDKNEREIDFVRIISNYVKSFKFSDPRIATEYIILIGLSTEKQNEQVQLCHEALRELVLETKEFSILLGSISRDGTRIPGVIEERLPLLHLRDESEFLRVITEQAARKADEDGRVHDSLLLYQLSEEYDIVLSIVNNLLGDILSNADLTQPLLQTSDNSETNPILLARKLITTYVDNLEISKKISNKNSDTCLFLLKMVDVRQAFLGKQWQQTLTMIKELNILPFADELSAREKAQEFTTLNENLIKCVPNMLIITMTCVSRLVENLNKSEYQSMEKAQQINSLKNIAKNCMIYAGVIQYKMPRETFSTLINLDVTL
ncbi:similar to Saccharomyces cerevisiae YFR002W NIC96 Component of the nuclear pore complex, required for nuclear pore formation [Maudiozyma saulgeensis]|uniref:Nuclear pore protein n=1 Tax=Maudiozyma saulgeensis TaxID=1789683 RepID=A0A1X7R0Y3_9SACH|nr:similar to Saccharomyces cerevisiae YFR002W NIC96 Component of the nuclear pore complex, required for nuclear pore formation [Kazachstania saulgeensis]